MRKIAIVLAAGATLALMLAAGVKANDGATVTRRTLPSGILNGTTFYPATCDETQVINANQRIETFQCSFDAGAPAPVVCSPSKDCFWNSDFDGAPATDFRFIITPSGELVGWAKY
jgi:hypothetical protein